MKDWIKKNKDAIIITTLGITATALVAGVTYKATVTQANHVISEGNMRMASVAYEAGVLEKILEHQDKILKLANA